jgi:aminoglycoside/choline kinase family phosphotransferase
MPDPRSALARLFEAIFGAPPRGVMPMAGGGSLRQMIRYTAADGRTAVGVIGPDPKENRAFISFSRALRGAGLPVPEILGEDAAAGVYLVEDLGDVTLCEALEEARRETGESLPKRMRVIYEQVLDWLPRLQIDGARAIDFADAHPAASYDAQAMQWDLSAFKYLFLRLGFVSFDEALLERDFQTLIAFLQEEPADYFLHRDLQSRNVMLRDGEPVFIDYQGGRKGPLQYDVAKLLYEGRTALTEEIRAELLEIYLASLRQHLVFDEARFRAHYRGFVLIRILQGLSAYGYIGLYQRKPHFIQSIPPAQRNLAHLLETGLLKVPLPELARVLERVVNLEAPGVSAPEPDRLTVRLQSFSYKRGIPGDPGGHGGGHVFDCRGVPNPGREAAYRPLTGQHPDVIQWLESKKETAAFYESARAIVDGHVAVWRKRDFRSLLVQFGCTGGQHRSVYFTDRLARHLREQVPDAHVEVDHREAPFWPK